MRFMRVTTSNTAGVVATVPPAKPVPAPRGITAVSCFLADLTMAATSAVLCGNTTRLGSPRSIPASLLNT